MINENDKPLLSVIVAIYNIENYIEKCICSIMEQSYQNLEILLIDDGSTDQSGTIADRYAGMDKRIKVIHKVNGGLSDARNEGIDVCKGEYIAFVDGDDWIDKDMYSNLLSAMLKESADMGICRYRQIYKDKVIDESTGMTQCFEGRATLACFIKEEDRIQIQNAAWNKVYKRELLGDQRFPVGKWYEDIVFTTILLSKVQRCVYLDLAYYNYVLEREGSIMSKGFSARILSDQIPAYLEKGEFLRGIGADDLAAIHEYFFLKRLLIYYTMLSDSKNDSKNKFCNKLDTIIRSRKAYIPSAFQWEGANKNEWYKLRVFLISPVLYRVFMKINEKWILPLKIAKQESKKIIVQLSGGLGNQMFQYALFYQLRKMGRTVLIDDVTGYQDQTERQVQLSVFDISYPTPTRQDLIKITDSSMKLRSRIRRKILGRRTKVYLEKQFNFDSTIFQTEHAYLEGCWQSEKYFADVKEELLEKFHLPTDKIDKKNQEVKEQINACCSVSMHIRRGDYLEEEHVGLYGGICTPAYYQRAIQYMKEHLDNPVFFIFSNDPTWARENFSGENSMIVGINSEEQGYLDMMLMSECKHNILANSSFSWWGAWLNRNPEKIVIAPEKWLNGRDCSDIYTDRMLAI